ncbi:hypothetical protein I0C86_41595 [Plantactinospora sp. S1510]|uniref:Uncharacterized protein n=1 Tax=Plantactinospora alkalitolerans TaxID=2789879 RepID=A0ABS0HA40_9ACTN|nr:hypothetical protein [Plantactinospora alkalitolerans]MBF9135348.1 hypothetical protein [Plantactinospora alkalitolerans]
MAAVVFLVCVLCVATGCFVGYMTGRTAEVRAHMRRYGITPKSSRLLTSAAKILNRLVTVTDLDGDLAADLLSPGSRRQVDTWLAEYRKEIS